MEKKTESSGNEQGIKEGLIRRGGVKPRPSEPRPNTSPKPEKPAAAVKQS